MYNWPKRKPLRLKNYDYSENWFYFVTICIKEKQEDFGEIINWKMILNDYGEIAEKYWKEIIKHYQNVEIDEFVIMPNHIHWIIIVSTLSVGNEYFRSDNWDKNKNNSKPNISNIIKWFKIWCTKEIRYKYENFNFNFKWQKSFFDVIIKNDKQLEKSRQYIINNPLKWELDINNPINIDLKAK